MKATIVELSKYIAVLLSMVLGVIGSLTEFKKSDGSGQLTRWGRVNVSLIVLASLFAMGAQFLESALEEESSAREMSRQLTAQEQTLGQIRRAIEPVGRFTANYTLEIPADQPGLEAIEAEAAKYETVAEGIHPVMVKPGDVLHGFMLNMQLVFMLTTKSSKENHDLMFSLTGESLRKALLEGMDSASLLYYQKERVFKIQMWKADTPFLLKRNANVASLLDWRDSELRAGVAAANAAPPFRVSRLQLTLTASDGRTLNVDFDQPNRIREGETFFEKIPGIWGER